MRYFLLNILFVNSRKCKSNDGKAGMAGKPGKITSHMNGTNLSTNGK